MENGNLDLAANIFLEILKIEPDNISAAALYSRCLIRLGKTEEAENVINSISGETEKNQEYISVCSEMRVRNHMSCTFIGNASPQAYESFDCSEMVASKHLSFMVAPKC